MVRFAWNFMLKMLGHYYNCSSFNELRLSMEKNAPRKASICTGILLLEFIKTIVRRAIHSYCSFLWASLILWKALSGSPHHHQGWSFQSVLGRPARSGFLSLHSAPSIKHTGEKEFHHSILQTPGGTTMCWDAPLPLLYWTPSLQTISRLDLPITDCLGGFLGETGDGMSMGPGKSAILRVTVRLCTRSDHWVAAFTGVVLGTGTGTVALKRNRGCLKV